MGTDTSQAVLIVDDSPTMRSMIRKALAAAGYQVVEAVDGIEALSRLEQHSVQAILTDVNMPRMGGLAFIAAVRKDSRFARIPILALTTEQEPEVKAAGKAAGATGWIVKPFEPAQLCQVVETVIRRMATTSPAA